MELRLAGYEEKLAHMAQLKQYALEQLLTIDGVVRIGNGDAPHILSVSLVGYPSANVVTELGAQGICISAGSACHRGKLSHVYAAMKLEQKDGRGRSARELRARDDARGDRRVCIRAPQA